MQESGGERHDFFCIKFEKSNSCRIRMRKSVIFSARNRKNWICAAIGRKKGKKSLHKRAFLQSVQKTVRVGDGVRKDSQIWSVYAAFGLESDDLCIKKLEIVINTQFGGRFGLETAYETRDWK